jgi:hypothetical protein
MNSAPQAVTDDKGSTPLRRGWQLMVKRGIRNNALSCRDEVGHMRNSEFDLG